MHPLLPRLCLSTEGRMDIVWWQVNRKLALLTRNVCLEACLTCPEKRNFVTPNTACW